jgi:hypothetical protein
VQQLCMEMRMMWKSWRCCWRFLSAHLPETLLVTLSLSEYSKLLVLAGILHADWWHIKQINDGKLGQLIQVHSIMDRLAKPGLLGGVEQKTLIFPMQWKAKVFCVFSKKLYARKTRPNYSSGAALLKA